MTHPTDDDLRRALGERVKEFGNLSGMSASAIGVRALNDGAVVDRILAGKDFLVSTYRKLMDWIDRNWDLVSGTNGSDETFEVLESTASRKVKDVAASISYALARGGRPRRREVQGRSTAGAPRLIVGLPSAAVMKWPYPETQGFVFARGILKARLVMCDAGGTPFTPSRGGGAFYFGHMPILGDDVQQKEWVNYRRLDPEAENGAVIEIDCPSWLRAS